MNDDCYLYGVGKVPDIYKLLGVILIARARGGDPIRLPLSRSSAMRQRHSLLGE